MNLSPRLSMILCAGLLAASAPGQKLVVWGSSSYAMQQLPSGLSGVKQVALGIAHGIALKKDGTVVAWGDNDFGQCTVPSGLSHVVEIAAGDNHSLALRADGTVVAWGKNNFGQTDPPLGLTNAAGIAVGGLNSLAVRADGTVVGWGYNVYGQSTPPVGLTDVVAVAGAFQYSYALRANGTLVGFGWNSGDQYTVPAGLAGVTQVSMGHDHTIALKSDGHVAAWGRNTYGALNVPAGLENVLQVCAGTWVSAAIVRDFSVSVDQTSIVSGGVATGTVRISDPAGPGGQVLQLNASNGLLRVPETVKVPAGQVSATFPIATAAVFGAGGKTTVTLSDGAFTAHSPEIQVTGHPLTAQVEGVSVTGGTHDPLALKVDIQEPLSEDVTFQVISSDPAVLASPVTVPAGATTASVALGHEVVATDRSVSLTLRIDGNDALSAVFPLRSLNGSIAVDTDMMSTGDTAQGTVGLNGKVRSPLVVALSSNDPAVTVPATVTIPAGGNRAYFPVTAVGTGPRTVTLTASINGHAKITTVFLNTVPTVASVSLPANAVGWTEIGGNVTLAGPAPVGGVRVRLYASDLALKVPAYVWVPEGATTASFVANTDNVSVATSSTLTAEVTGSAATATIAVEPLAIQDLVLPASVRGGQNVEISIVLNAAPNRNVVVGMHGTEPYYLRIPPGKTVLKGETTRTFSLPTQPTGTNRTLTVTATFNGVTVTRTIQLTR